MGTLFSLDGNGNNFKKLHDFDDLTGANPFQAITQGPDKTLYGTAAMGGALTFGTIFKINPDGTGFTKLLDFDDAVNKGLAPYAALLVGQDGRLYGTTNGGGSNNNGTMFSFNTDGSGFKKLFDFGGTNGGGS